MIINATTARDLRTELIRWLGERARLERDPWRRTQLHELADHWRLVLLAPEAPADLRTAAHILLAHRDLLSRRANAAVDEIAETFLGVAREIVR